MLNGEERKIAEAGEACLRIAPGSDAKRGVLITHISLIRFRQVIIVGEYF
jgi:hypothetical protein